MTIYNRDGFMEPNPYDSYSANNVTSVADSDGSVTLDLAPEDDGFTNHLYVMEGWTSSSGCTSRAPWSSMAGGSCRRSSGWADATHPALVDPR